MTSASSLLLQPLVYDADSSNLFAKIAHEEWAVFLDSGKPAGQYGRYDIISSRPFITITTQKGVTTVSRNGKQEHCKQADPFQVLKSVLAGYPQTATDLPFTGGA
ncbi:MAG: aminodeoxychorismate synthase component I, partial [Nitrosomonadales bacterium]|nr:aminodeoxychorismate synthase component I [Nitrosomonadales bacterium]